MNCGGSDYLDLRSFHNFGGSDKLGARGDNGLRTVCPLSYLEIYNPYFVALSRESLEKMMALMRPTFNPVRLLQDEYLHCIAPVRVCYVQRSEGFLSPPPIHLCREDSGNWRPRDNRPSIGEPT